MGLYGFIDHFATASQSNVSCTVLLSLMNPQDELFVDWCYNNHDS